MSNYDLYPEHKLYQFTGDSQTFIKGAWYYIEKNRGNWMERTFQKWEVKAWIQSVPGRLGVKEILVPYGSEEAFSANWRTPSDPVPNDKAVAARAEIFATKPINGTL